MSWNDAIDGLKTIFDLVAANSTASILSVVGISLLILAIALGLKAATMDPAKVPGWFSTAFLCTVGGAMLFSLAGPFTAILSKYSESDRPRISAEKAIDDLRVNAPVKWLIRLISFNPQTQKDLSIRGLSMLGPSNQKYVFVADYAELTGQFVETAVQMAGGSINQGDHVSAAIFPLPRPENLYPANARGCFRS